MSETDKTVIIPVSTSPTKKRRPATIAGVVVISVAAVLTLATTGYMFAFKDRVFPGVTIGGLNLGGLTKTEASAKLNASISIFENKGLNFSYEGKTENITPTQIPNGNADAAYQIFDIDQEQGLNNAYAVGRSGNLSNCVFQAISALQGRQKFALTYKLDETGFKNALTKAWRNKETPVNDAKLSIYMSGNSFSTVRVIPETSGFEFDYSRAISDFKLKASTLDMVPVELVPLRTNATITAGLAEATKHLVPQALLLAPLELSADDKKWTLGANKLSQLLEIYIQPDGMPSLRINNEEAQKYFKQLALDYDIKPSNTRYEVDQTTQKMTVFKQGTNGRKIDILRSANDLENALQKQLAGTDGKIGFNLTTALDKTQIVSSSVADLGIKEIIGVGQSDFSGSSTNRIKNVSHGSSKLNGILIGPGEEFSANKALDPITIEDGYFPEQIILGDKIEPAVGGGLCQIGTTLFRMAMNTGLPITERQNHSLVVHYYADATNGNPGTDATLYGPHPDLRFVNNTGYWMLLTTDINVKTKKLTYTLWGTSDGRSGSYTPPQVLNWISPSAEVTNIEDPTMEAGKQKCQNAFRGANTTFTYTIVNPDATITERKFTSHYRALPKICTNGPAVTTPLPESGTPTDGTEMNNINAPIGTTTGN